MGLSSSQVRYLFLAAEMHNINLKVQNIENQKIMLATQQDEIYEKYCDALDKTRLQVRYYDGITAQSVDATFASMCDFTDAERSADYRLINSKTGLLYVDESVANAYKNFKNDKYMFAWAAMGFNSGINSLDCGDMCWTVDANGNPCSSEGFGKYVGVGVAKPYIGQDIYMTDVEKYVYDNANDSDLQEKYSAIVNAPADSDEQVQALADFRDYLYRNYAEDIFNLVVESKNDVPGNNDVVPEYRGMTWEGIEAQFNYYLDLFDQIKEVGGCEGLSKEYQSGSNGAQWLNSMVEAGLVTIQVHKTSGTEIGWKTTSPDTDLNITQINLEEDIAHAEAEYNHDLDIMKTKEQKLDNDLKKMETRYQAAQSQMDSLKKVMDDNIKRTMNIPSA